MHKESRLYILSRRPAKPSGIFEHEKSVTYMRENFRRMNLLSEWNCILGKKYINGCRRLPRDPRSKIDRVETLLSYRRFPFREKVSMGKCVCMKVTLLSLLAFTTCASKNIRILFLITEFSCAPTSRLDLARNKRIYRVTDDYKIKRAWKNLRYNSFSEWWCNPAFLLITRKHFRST